MAVVGSPTYTAGNAGRAWSLTATSQDIFRFEVRDGDYASADGSSERSNLVYKSAVPVAAPLHLNFDLTIEPGAANTANYLVLGSFVSTMTDGTTAKLPIFDLDLMGEHLVAYVRYNDANGKVISKQIYIDPAHFERGDIHNVDVKAVVDPSGNGRLVLSRDGVVLADYKGPFGYAGQQSVSWSEGIDRSANATETMAVNFGHLTLESGSSVTMPDQTSFIQAPSLAIKNVSYLDEASDTFVASMFGYALGRSTVSIYADGELVGTTKAGSNGYYSLAVNVKAEGAHKLIAVSSDTAGRPGIASYPANFTIGDAGDPGALQPISFILAQGGETYWIENANKSWSISAPEPDALRFEVRDRDVYWWDLQHGATSERSEARSEKEIANGTALDISYKFNIEPGAVNNAYFMVLGQLHQDDYDGAQPWSPPFALALEGERMVLDVRYSGADGMPVTKRIFTDTADFKRGVDHDIDIKAVFDPSGSGRLVVSRDGVILADYSGPLGYDDQNGVYWKYGIYRHSNATDPIAVNYKEMAIKTGNSVAFPDKNAFIAAPKLNSSTVSAPDADGDRAITVTGSAKAGTHVVFYEDGVQLASAAADANGRFTVSWAFPTDGHHSFRAVSSDDAGHVGLTSGTLTVQIDTAANVAAAIQSLAKESGLVSIVLTDTNVLPVASRGQIDTMMKSGAAALSKIQGEFFFQITTAITGRPYDEQVETYTSAGILMDRERFVSGNLVYDEAVASDGSKTIKSYTSTGAVDVTSYDAAGKVVHSERYNSANVLYHNEVRYADGSRITHDYNQTTGIETAYTAFDAGGRKQVATVNIANQSYKTQIYTYSPSGALLSQERFTGDGVKLYSQLWRADGTYSISSFQIAGQFYASKTVFHSSAGKAVGTDTFDATGKLLTSDLSGSDGSRTVFAISNGVKLGFTQTSTDGSKTVVAFAAGHPEFSARIDRYDGKGALASTSLFDNSGHKISTLSVGSDGARTLTAFDPVTGSVQSQTVTAVDGSFKTYTLDAAGLKIGALITAADGSYQTLNFVAGHEELPTLVAKFTAQGRMFEIDKFDAAGRLVKVELYNFDASRETHTYDAATGKETSYAINGPDRSYRVEANLNVLRKDYAQQIATYDASGRLVEMVRKHGDADHTLAFVQRTMADGSSEIRNYDLSGREMAKIATASDGSRDAFAFTYADASSATPATSRQDHFAPNGAKQWTDTTNADASHAQASHVGGTTLSSHAGVADTFRATKSGIDTFVFKAGFGKDTVVAFAAGSGANHDVLAFDDRQVSDYAHLQAMMTKVGADTLITLSATDTVLLKNVLPNVLVAADFKFVHHQDGLHV